jgi:hypothetical protein
MAIRHLGSLGGHPSRRALKEQKPLTCIRRQITFYFSRNFDWNVYVGPDTDTDTDMDTMQDIQANLGYSIHVRRSVNPLKKYLLPVRVFRIACTCIY